MAASEAFERSTARVLEVLDTVHAGRCTTYGDIAHAVGVVPRYVALVMARAPEVATSPWHRVVGAGGVVRPGSHRTEQVRRLRAEGVSVTGERIDDFASVRVPAGLLTHHSK